MVGFRPRKEATTTVVLAPVAAATRYGAALDAVYGPRYALTPTKAT